MRKARKLKAKVFSHIPQQRYLDKNKTITLVYSTDPKDQWVKSWRAYEANHPTDLNGSPCSYVTYVDWSDEAIHCDNRAWSNPIANLDIYLQWELRKTEGKWEDSIKSMLRNPLTIKSLVQHD